GLVGADLLEGHAGAAEDGVVVAAEQVLDGPACLQLQAADLTQDLARQHGLSPSGAPILSTTDYTDNTDEDRKQEWWQSGRRRQRFCPVLIRVIRVIRGSVFSG